MQRTFPHRRPWSRPLCLALVFAALLGGLGCAEHHYYRVYDPYYHDYHRWDHQEAAYYDQWAVETHRDPHRDFKGLNDQEKKEYWTWRHSHPDHDHDKH